MKKTTANRIRFDGDIKPTSKQSPLGATKPTPFQCKTGKGTITMRCAAWDEARLRKAARVGGWQFKMFCDFALHNAAAEIEERLGLTFDEMSALSKKQVENLYRKNLLISRIPQIYLPKRLN